MKIKIIGRKYLEAARYLEWDTSKRFPVYDMDEERVWEIEAETLDDGELWLAENHPDYYMGANVICENGDFACEAIPCEEYGKGNYETIAARIAFVKAEAEYIANKR
jgi:hypothetical protein